MSVAESEAQAVQRTVSTRSLMTLAIIFFIVITIVTFIPVPPALLGYIFAFVFGERYMRSSFCSLSGIAFLGTVCGISSFIGLSVLHATILSFLPSSLVFLAIGASLAFWLGNLREHWKTRVRRDQQIQKVTEQFHAFVEGKVTTKKVGNAVIIGISSEEEELVDARLTFSKQYCKERGWDVERLGLNQVMEIREQPGWKHPFHTVDAS